MKKLTAIRRFLLSALLLIPFPVKGSQEAIIPWESISFITRVEPFGDVAVTIKMKADNETFKEIKIKSGTNWSWIDSMTLTINSKKYEVPKKAFDGLLAPMFNFLKKIVLYGDRL